MPQGSHFTRCHTRSWFDIIIALHCFGRLGENACRLILAAWKLISFFFTFASTALTFVHYTQKMIDTQ